MPDYIIFYNWPDIEAYHRNKYHPYDNLTIEERYGEYLRLKNENPKMSDEELGKSIGKTNHYFREIKRRIKENKQCNEKHLLRSV